MTENHHYSTFNIVKYTVYYNRHTCHVNLQDVCHITNHYNILHSPVQYYYAVYNGTQQAILEVLPLADSLDVLRRPSLLLMLICMAFAACTSVVAGSFTTVTRSFSPRSAEPATRITYL